MTVNGEQQRVVAGDAVPLNAGGSHGLVNDSDKPLMVMVIECKMTREAKLETEKVDPRLRGAAADVIAEFKKAQTQS
jgi:quercetin dioxygenase-like cupin family protein